jgi:hypothetical protein
MEKMETAKTNRPKLLNVAPRFGSTNFDETAAFYEKIEFQVDYRDEGFMILKCDEVVLHWNLFDEPFRGGSVCWITIAGIDELYNRCRSNGIEVSPPGKTEYGVREIVVRDPSCHLLIFAEPIE